MKQPIQNHHLKRHSKRKEKAYFASKTELLSFINKTLDLDIKSIDLTITGAIFCQLLDAAHPGTVRMNKVNWKAKLETEYISNFKVFQQGLSINNIEKPINITRLSKGKTQELIELLQWLYGHHISLGINPANYDALKKRNGQNFIFFGDKVKSINTINNKSVRDDLSQCSSATDIRDYQMKNNLNNTKNLNTNLVGNNFHTKFNYQNQKNSSIKNKQNKQNKLNAKKIIKNNSLNSNNISNLSSSSNSGKNNDSSNKHFSGFNDSPFIIDEKPEENIKDNEDEKLNNILFDGISNLEKEKILELERFDGNNIHDLKIIIRKLRVNNMIFKSNISTILNKLSKERTFYLNKLKDIEYLYFNPIIQNSNDNKKELLKSILSSQSDTTLIINEEGFASIKGNKIFSSLLNHEKEDIDKIDKINIENVMEANKNDKNFKNGRNSQKMLHVKLIYSKANKNDIEVGNKSKEEKINKTQPDTFRNIKNERNINEGFSIKNNDLKNNIIHATPTSKTCYYDISSHILNEPLHIPNTENMNPNLQ